MYYNSIVGIAAGGEEEEEEEGGYIISYRAELALRKYAL
jgi:hypothetical protein